MKVQIKDIGKFTKVEGGYKIEGAERVLKEEQVKYCGKSATVIDVVLECLVLDVDDGKHLWDKEFFDGVVGD